MTKWSNQYKDPRWQKKRLEVMEAHKYSCRVCYCKDSTLNVHHKHYDYGKCVWEYDIDELECLCEKCHEKLHKDQKRIKKLMEIRAFRYMSLSMWDKIFEEWDEEDILEAGPLVIESEVKLITDLITISRKHFDCGGSSFIFLHQFITAFSNLVEKGECNDYVTKIGIKEFMYEIRDYLIPRIKR